MKRSLISLLLVFICLFFIFVSTAQVNSQSVSEYGAKYKVKPGDTMQYRYSIIKIQSRNFIATGIRVSNGTYIPINITTSTKLTITVTAVNKTSGGQDQVFMKTEISNPGQKSLISAEDYPYSYITVAFDNKSIVEKYVNDISNQQQSSNYGYSYSVSGDYISAESHFNSSDQITNYKVSLNWKTGWVKYTEQETIASNGTTLTHVRLEQISNNLVGSIINFTIDGISILSLVALIAVPTFVFYSYKKFTKASIQNKNISFTQYVKTKGKKSNPRKFTKPTQTNKALGMIDEILQENK